MPTWTNWRRRAKDWKKDRRLSDAGIAAELGVERGTVNSWLNKREPNLSDFMALCIAMEADPKEILFGTVNRSGEHPTRLVDSEKPKRADFREVGHGRRNPVIAPQRKQRRRKSA